jgi:hypothetical protein
MWGTEAYSAVTSNSRNPCTSRTSFASALFLLELCKKDKFVPRATGFLVNYFEKGLEFPHLVTAMHVVSRLSEKGHKLWMRVNMPSGDGGHYPFSDNVFHFHPKQFEQATDVAICPFSNTLIAHDGTEHAVDFAVDFRTVGLNGPNAMVATEEVVAERNIGTGDEIAIVGLFRSHYGRERNVPIVRIGNISAMREEPVFTRYAGYIDAYLIEARSIGGLSGSPVFALGAIPNQLSRLALQRGAHPRPPSFLLL